uniref:G-protein coupled receptors family 3 profile domain-containing protein n=1 Tax=Anopheles atroparvus TaxID=41427 RepID=A0AAG5DN62_ANOAO
MARRPKRSALVLAIALAIALCSQVTTVHYRCLAQAAGGNSVPPVNSAEAELADLEVAESNNHQLHRALLNLPKFGDRLSPRVGPGPGPGVSVPGVTVVSGKRQARGQLHPRGPQHQPIQPLHNAPNDNNDIKRSDVMVVSSRSASGARGVTQDLLSPEEEEDDDDSERNRVGEESAGLADTANGRHAGGVGVGDYYAEEEDEQQEPEQEPEPEASVSVDRVGSVAASVLQQTGAGSILNNASSAQAHRLEMSTEFFVVPSTAASAASRSTTVRPGGVILAARNPPQPPLVVAGGPRGTATPPTIVSTGAAAAGAGYASGLRKEPWVVPVLVLASLSMLMMAAFEVFVLCKAWRTSPSRRHLFLGQMLLLGLFACSGLAAVLTVNPTVLSCATMRFGAGVAFALVFASLLVKCVFLISLNGGVYLPAPYQGLLLLFAVLIQVAVGGQWLLTSPPSVDSVSVASGPVGMGTGVPGSAISSRYHLLMAAGELSPPHPNGATATSTSTTTTTIPLCHTPFSELLLSLIYIVFLILFVAILAIKSRGIRDNYREATYIGLAIGGIIPIWLGWTLCGLAVADRHRDACLAFGLVATASTVFLVMFMPKGRQLAAMGKEGLYVEDREERFSSLSRAGSGYSPSFFHFKPIKYGVMGPSPTLQTASAQMVGTAATATAKHQAVATLGGDRVALVTAPPSYTPRMYHYFPAHMTHPFCYYPSLAPQQARYPGLFMRPDETNLYTTLEQTMSSNPNVYFQRGGGVHPGMMY